MSSSLVQILKVLKTRAKSKNIFDVEFALTNQKGGNPPTEGGDTEVELVDHLAGAGRY